MSVFGAYAGFSAACFVDPIQRRFPIRSQADVDFAAESLPDLPASSGFSGFDPRSRATQELRSRLAVLAKKGGFSCC